MAIIMCSKSRSASRPITFSRRHILYHPHESCPFDQDPDWCRKRVMCRNLPFHVGLELSWTIAKSLGVPLGGAFLPFLDWLWWTCIERRALRCEKQRCWSWCTSNHPLRTAHLSPWQKWSGGTSCARLAASAGSEGNPCKVDFDFNQNQRKCL